MDPPPVIVVGETPSLGSAVRELILADGLEAALVPDIARAEEITRSTFPRLPKVLVSTPAHRASSTAQGWSEGVFRSVPLVVVGTRYTGLTGAERIHFVTLPLSPRVLLGLIRRLLGESDLGASCSDLDSSNPTSPAPTDLGHPNESS